MFNLLVTFIRLYCTYVYHYGSQHANMCINKYKMSLTIVPSLYIFQQYNPRSAHLSFARLTYSIRTANSAFWYVNIIDNCLID